MKIQNIFDTKCEKELTIWIGTDAQDNWDIIDKASQFDYWFHLDDKPSCHVILRLPDKKTKVNKQSLIHCAALCKENSKYKDHKKITVIYTEIKNISKGEDVGSVFTKRVNRIIV